LTIMVGSDSIERQLTLSAAALDCAGEGIIIVDPFGRALLVNEAARRFLGGDIVEGRPDAWADTYGLFRPDGVTPLPPDEVPLVRALAGETVIDAVMISRRPSLGDIVLSVNARPLTGPDLPTGAIVTVRNVTDRTRAEDYARGAQEQLVALNRRLEERVRTRTGELEAFSYSVSHDLRAPLRAMNGFTRILLDEYADVLPATALDYLAKVRDNAAQLGQLVDALLDLSRTQRRKLHRRPVDMGELARRVAAEACGRERPRTFDLIIDELPGCHGDPTMLRQAWSHLLGNAAKFTRTSDHPRIEVTGRVRGDEVEYRVRDNGVGFDSRYADKLFKVFQRLHQTGEFEGTGIGLALTDVIAGRHGGRVWATATPGGGATFHFTVCRRTT
jgi:signal transduction histidine kinase